MLNEKMQKAVDNFILARVNDFGSSESGAVQEAMAEFLSKAQQLKSTLSPEQSALFTECENAYGLLDGETMQYYYRAGFSDAVLFLMGWRNGEWNE